MKQLLEIKNISAKMLLKSKKKNGLDNEVNKIQNKQQKGNEMRKHTKTVEVNRPVLEAEELTNERFRNAGWDKTDPQCEHKTRLSEFTFHVFSQEAPTQKSNEGVSRMTWEQVGSGSSTTWYRNRASKENKPNQTKIPQVA